MKLSVMARTHGRTTSGGTSSWHACARYTNTLVTSGQTHRQTDRQRDRQTDRQAERQTDRQAERQTDRQTDRQTGRETDRQTDRQAERQTDRQTETKEQNTSSKWCVQDTLNTRGGHVCEQALRLPGWECSYYLATHIRYPSTCTI